MLMSRLGRSFFTRSGVLSMSTALLGKYIFTRLPEKTGASCRLPVTTGGMIVETEAYCANNDLASHASRGRRTARTEIMYREGGIAYVYLCYGIHSLLNIVINREGIPDAVLIRAIQPTHGTDAMLKRRGRKTVDRRLAGSPATLTQAMGITRMLNGEDLTGRRIWIEDRGISIRRSQIERRRRIGVEYAGKDADKLWRFRVKNNPWIVVDY
ncbi:MAG: DNA-3-methyladenine glycosylase [Kiritimatiellia bacterium]